MQRIVLASGNQGKLNELRLLLQPLGWDVVSQKELGVVEAEETGLTFVENAILKARNAALQTGLPSLADDSGLSIEALAGAPGIYSARYSGMGDLANNEKVLRELTGVENRRAQFICVLALVKHAKDPVPLICQGHWRGEILTSPEGRQGFGYDPIFKPDQCQVSAANLAPEEKSAISHRGLAMGQLLDQLSDRLC